MSRRKNVLTVTTGILIGILMAGTTARAAGAPPIRANSYKGTVPEVGERSGLVIGPSGTTCTVTSSDLGTVAVEQVMSCQAVVAKAEGSVEVTVSNQVGETGTLALIMGPNAPQTLTTRGSPDQSEVSDVRSELVRLVNETHRESGVAGLTVNETLMNTTRSISDKEYSQHHTKGECEAALTYDHPYGFGVNLAVFANVATEDVV